ncbi:MAG: hypothetical protein JXA21_04160 [Anaerolineae bacterium]|nr:hypothetical protein [Anaerolineae bacterium]
MSKKPKNQFQLLPYLILSKRWFGPACWLIPGGYGLWWAAPKLFLPDPGLRILLLGVSVIGGLLAIYALLAHRARITLHKQHFVIHTPFYPIGFSYARIFMTRPVMFSAIFPPENEKRARWRMYQSIWGRTVVAIDLKAFPMPRWWLELWLHPYLLHPHEKTLILPIEDWMALSRQIEDHRVSMRENRRRP